MAYSLGYFHIQLQFAQKVSSLTGLSLEESLLNYTSFYKTFRIDGWKFAHGNPTWQNFLINLQGSKDALKTIYDFYLHRLKEVSSAPGGHKDFGCFSYEYEAKDKSISIHFRNADSPDPGALSQDRLPARQGELSAMFREIKFKHPDAKIVTGFSWLYNLSSYNRLFPPEYQQHRQVVSDWFRSTALWGQFLDSAGKLKDTLVQPFLAKVSASQTISDLAACFPYQVIKVSANIDYFYQFYSIGKRD